MPPAAGAVPGGVRGGAGGEEGGTQQESHRRGRRHVRVQGGRLLLLLLLVWHLSHVNGAVRSSASESRRGLFLSSKNVRVFLQFVELVRSILQLNLPP